MNMSHGAPLAALALAYAILAALPLRPITAAEIPPEQRQAIEAIIHDYLMQNPDVLIEALRAVEKATTEPICYLISGDLAHIGPQFGDPDKLSRATLAHSKKRDQAIIKQAEHGGAADYFAVIAEENDERRICGLSPTWTVLEAAQPSRGRVLNYSQYVQPDHDLSVSFASMAFYR